MKTLQVKLLAAILAVLVVIAGYLIHGLRPSYTLTDQEKQTQKTFDQKVQPPNKPYLEP
jgi:hypothetical protein